MKKACSVCVSNCVRLHGGVEEDEDANACLFCAVRKPKEVEDVANVQAGRNPSFLKKITESTMSTLKIPLSFVADHTERLGESVILEGPGKEHWRVELHRSARSFSVSFGQGWEQFVGDHVLQIGDQLSFSLSEKSHLQVEVYDGFGVQKRSALDATNTSLELGNVEPKEIQGVDVAPTEKPEEHDKPENATQSADERLIDLVNVQSSESESRIVSGPGNVMGIAEVVGLEDSEERKTTELVEIGKREELLPSLKLVGGKVVSQRRPVTEHEKVRALQGAHALELVNPNTLMVMCKGHVYKGFWLPIPKQFAKDWLPSENKEIVLVNKSGHQWPAKWLAVQGGLSAGWRRFSLDHRLEEHDVCVLELIDKVNYTLLVHIFRAIGGPDEDPGLYTLSSTSLRSSEGKKNSRKSFPTESNGHMSQCTHGKGQESVNKPNDKSTQDLILGVEKENPKRKLCLDSDEASGSLVKVKKLANDQAHQNVEKVVNQASVDERVGERSGNKAAMNNAVEPRASCGGETNPVVVPQVVSRDSRTDLVKLAKDLLTRKSLGIIDPPGAQAASADEVHEQISNFADVPMPASDQPTPSRTHRGQSYEVVHIYRGRNVGNDIEYLTEIEGYKEGSSIVTPDRDDNTGFWWIHSDLFEWDMQHCYLA